MKVLEKATAHKEESTIREIRDAGEYWEIKKADGWCFGLSKKFGYIPKIGDQIFMYGEPFKRIQGVDINGSEVYFKTKAEMDKEHRQWVEKWKKEQHEKYLKLMEQIKDEPPFETVDISGMGGGYERACQLMLQAGVKFLNENPEFHFDYQGYKNVYGVCYTDTPWGKQLDKTISDAVNGDLTGAMHQAVIQHLMYIHKHGYEEWLQASLKERRYMYPSGLPSLK